MKLLTFNMTAGLPVAEAADRLDALGKLVQSRRPEFLALQNVTNETLKKITRTTWGSRYNVIQPPYFFETRKLPTVAMLSTYPAEDSMTLNYHETPSGKVVLKGYYVMYDKLNQPYVICVATTSLEKGLKLTEFREKQLNEACLSMKDAENAFLLGDFSLDNDIDGDLELRGGWVDSWLAIAGNTESSGYTYDPEKNPLIKEDPFGPGRPDRIFFKSRHYNLDSVELVGVEPYQLPEGQAVTISKHYGLLAQFSLLDIPKPKVEPCIVSALFKRTEWSVQFQENK